MIYPLTSVLTASGGYVLAAGGEAIVYAGPVTYPPFGFTYTATLRPSSRISQDLLSPSGRSQLGSFSAASLLIAADVRHSLRVPLIVAGLEAGQALAELSETSSTEVQL